MKLNFSYMLLFVFSIQIKAAFVDDHFEHIDKNSMFASTFIQLIEKIIVPLYGDQTETYSEIFERNCKSAYLLFNFKNEPLGALIFRNGLSQRFEFLDITNAVELKTLFVVDSAKNSGKGIGSKLLDKCLEYAYQLKAESIVVTISKNKDDAIHFFEHKGFQKILDIPGKYKKGITECIFVKSLIANKIPPSV